MAKTIKFNLLVDGSPIRTLDALRENFNVDDLLEHLKNGTLHKWLAVRGFEQEAGRVKALAGDDLQNLKDLATIFEVPWTPEIKESMFALHASQVRNKRLRRLADLSFREEKVIGEYHAEFDRLIGSLEDAKADLPKLKVTVGQIYEGHRRLVECNPRRTFDRIRERSPLAVYAMLMNTNIRAMLFGDEGIKREVLSMTRQLNCQLDTDSLCENYIADYGVPFKKWHADGKTSAVIVDKGNEVILLSANNPEAFIGHAGITDAHELTSMADAVGSYFDGLVCVQAGPQDEIHYIQTEDVPHRYWWGGVETEVSDRLNSFGTNTKGNWKTLRARGKRYLLLHLDEGLSARSIPDEENELSAEEVNETLPIVDGIAFQSQDDDGCLIFMEV